MEPNKANVKEDRKALLHMAQSYRLDGFRDLAMITKFAEKFSLHPDQVLSTAHNTVINCTIMWKEQEEFQERYTDIMQEATSHTSPNS